MPLAQTPLHSPFGPHSTAAEVVRAIDLRGKTAVVTGGAGGLGAEIVKALALKGARVVMPVRSRAAGESVAASLRAATGNPRIDVAAMDLADFQSVRDFAQAFVDWREPLHLLINNAGVMTLPEQRLPGGIEAQFGTNHLGHMILACALAPALLRTPGARVVSVSSRAHRRSAVDFTDPNFERRPYDKWEAYGQSKTANALFAVAFNRRAEPRGVTAFAAHPGVIMTELMRNLSREELQAVGWLDSAGKPSGRLRSPAQGAATPVWCATSALLTAGGVYCEDCNVATPVDEEDKGVTGVSPWAIDPAAAEQLWALSETQLQTKFVI